MWTEQERNKLGLWGWDGDITGLLRKSDYRPGGHKSMGQGTEDGMPLPVGALLVPGTQGDEKGRSLDRSQGLGICGIYTGPKNTLARRKNMPLAKYRLRGFHVLSEWPAVGF